MGPPEMSFGVRRRLHLERVAGLQRDVHRHFCAMVALIGLGVAVTVANALGGDERVMRGLWPMFASTLIWPEWRRRMRAVLTEHLDYVEWLKERC